MTEPVIGGPAPGIGQRTVLRNASVLAGATIAARVLMFALGIVLARELGAESYGRYSLALALGVVLQPLADLGLTPYMSREAARDHRLAERALPPLLLVKLALITAVLSLATAGAAIVTHESGLLLVLVAMVLAALLDSFSMFTYGYFQGRERMGFEARATAATALAKSVGGIALALGTGRLGPVVAWILLVAVAQALTAAWRLEHAVEAPGRLWPRRRPGAVQWRTVASMGLIGIFVMTYLRIDTVLIGWLLDERSVGLYAAPYTLVMAAQIPPLMLATALTPVFARTFRPSPADFIAAWHRGIELVLLIALPIALIVSLLAGPIISRFYGAEFEASGEVLAAIVWICPLGAVSLVIQAALRGAGRELWLTAVSGGCAVANVALNLWAIPRHGIMGAAVVTIVTELVNVFALAFAVLRAGIVPWPRPPVLRMILAAAALAAVAVALSGLPVEVVAFAAGAVYVAVLVATGVLSPAEIAALRRLVSRRG